MRTFKIGTRGSLLAVTQCTLIAQEMSKKTGANFELVKIKTQGDLQTEKPLWQLDGKDFFTKELDTALLKNQVDLVVHSYKDLGSDRPEGISLATITERKYANDILLIKKETIKKIPTLETFNVGTSSPRRIVNTEKSLADFLPGRTEKLEVKCSMLRGNVNTRIQKLQDGNYDAIILALAGLERLANKEESLKELKTLLDGLDFMIMPQNVFPSSASQGALAIEYNSNNKDEELLSVLKSVHCEKTAKEVAKERELFQTYGGGCHLAVGIHTFSHKDLLISIEKGEYDNKEIHNTTFTGANFDPSKYSNTFLSLGDADKLISKKLLSPKLLDNKQYFITSRYCIAPTESLKSSTFWASGTSTMKALVKSGRWVSGSADSLGHERIKEFINSAAVQIMTGSKEVLVLSHDKASSPIGETIGCYQRTLTEEKQDLSKYDSFYWPSFFQYESYVNAYPQIKDKAHFCGIGKTYDQFLSKKIAVNPIPNMQWLKKHFKTN